MPASVMLSLGHQLMMSSAHEPAAVFSDQRSITGKLTKGGTARSARRSGLAMLQPMEQ